jgi:uncharacterized glyoxalase superfamily protein PhnB
MSNAKAVKAIPDGYSTVTPWIISKNPTGLAGFLEKAFGAKEEPGSRMQNADGSVGPVEVKLGNSRVMLFDSHKTSKETPAFLRLCTEDVDSTYQQALASGATGITRPTELFWGDRVGRVRDPLGNIWWLQSRVKDVPVTDLKARKKEPAMVQAMQYVQQTLVEALKQSA